MRSDYYSYYPDERGRRRMLIRRIVRWTAASLVLLLVIGLVTSYLVYRHLDQNVEALDPDLGTDRPSRILVPGERQPLNILLLGSARRGPAGAGGAAVGEHESVTILLHLSADRRRAYGVSIPPEVVVSRPECPSASAGGAVSADGAAAFGTAYRLGREGCVVRTVEAMTNIRIDHFMVTSFEGFTAAADALDGVPIWMPTSTHDPRLDVTIPAGWSEARGDVALSYVTLRLDESSDIGRIRRQQAFLAAMTTKALSTGTLTNPLRLYSFLDRVTRAIAVDEDLADLRKLADLAGEIRGIAPENVHFLTMPIAPIAPVAAARVRFAVGPDAASLWRRLRLDRKLTSEQLLGSSTSAGGR